MNQVKTNVTYFFKVVENSTYVYGDGVNAITVAQSLFYSVFERNPVDNNGKITLRTFGFLTNRAFLNIIAQIQQNNILEYVDYKGVEMIRPLSNKKNGIFRKN